MNRIGFKMAGCLLLALAVVSLPGIAAEPVVDKSITAHQVVEQTTRRVMSIIDEAQGYFDKDPERFYRKIEVVLDEVVDFDSFARGVMGEYASKRMYMSLNSDEEKRQFLTRMRRFSETFREGLVRTYAKGLLSFNGQRIEVLPPTEEAVSGESVTVVQHIYSDAEKPYVVHYKLRQDKSGDWKLRNVTIEAINLGKIYQSQFASAAKLHNGDIDRVIDTWSVDPTTDTADAGTPDAG